MPVLIFLITLSTRVLPGPQIALEESGQTEFVFPSPSWSEWLWLVLSKVFFFLFCLSSKSVLQIALHCGAVAWILFAIIKFLETVPKCFRLLRNNGGLAGAISSLSSIIVDSLLL